ncbi:MraZ-like protein [Planctomycetes bacterium Pan216]|uniref:Transcriptional regulator MraZ n=1 Tax=Kolteria novifilia TaxID=2527975 RepID=A0A518B339_9BACT|nr:MraZ-like protein [Planctomycetes bacterium Pan216]
MTLAPQLITGEFRRVYDDRYRIALPMESIETLTQPSADCVLAKEREGCLSLWNAQLWQERIEGGVELLRKKLELNLLQFDMAKVQRFTRLLSTRSRPVKLGQRGRLLVPEGFREFLAVEPNNEVIIVGAGFCLEIWNPEIWVQYLRDDIGQFNDLFKELIS